MLRIAGLYSESLELLGRFADGQAAEGGCHMTAADLAKFRVLVKDLSRRHSRVLRWVMGAVYDLAEELGPEYEALQRPIDEFLERFLLVHIGLRFRMNLFLQVLEMDADTAEVARDVARDSREICREQLGAAPRVVVREEGDVSQMHAPSVLRYVLNEVLKNACRATVERHGGAGVLERELPAVHCTVSRGASGVSIRVRDEGCGIAPESLDRIFSFAYSTFGRTGREAERTRLAGFGVGLSMVRLYMMYFGGNVSVTSQLGKGTEVHLQLPDLDRLFEYLPEVPGPRPVWEDLTRGGVGRASEACGSGGALGAGGRWAPAPRAAPPGASGGPAPLAPAGVDELLGALSRAELPPSFAQQLRLLQYFAGRLAA